MRIFEGPINYENFHSYPNVFDFQPGANEIEIHDHEYPHLMVLGPGPWEITAIPPDGPQRVARLDVEDPFDAIEIRAKVKHGIRWLGTDRIGKLLCVFSRWNSNGEKLLEPKIKARHVPSLS